jgi:hypothetical protein
LSRLFKKAIFDSRAGNSGNLSRCSRKLMNSMPIRTQTAIEIPERFAAALLAQRVGPSVSDSVMDWEWKFRESQNFRDSFAYAHDQITLKTASRLL